MGRILALDVGQKRTGVATTDLLKMIANGLTTIETRNILDFLKNYLENEPIDSIVIGMPRQMNNELSENAATVNAVSKSIAKKFPDIELIFFDERFTSKIAHRVMIDAGIKKKKRQNKALVDEISASIILQDYLESLRINSSRELDLNKQ